MTKRRVIPVLLLALIMVLGTVGPAMAFSDVAGKWSEGYVDWATEQGYLQGYPDGSFKPNEMITKAEFYSIVNRMAGATTKTHVSYADVNDGSWYYDEVAKGIAMGYLKDDVYNHYPNQAITREDAARILAYVYKLGSNAEQAYIFTDSAAITYKGEVGALVNANVLHGYLDGSFKPNNGLRRSEVAKMVTVSQTTMGKPSAFVVEKEESKDYYYPGYYYGRYYKCDYPTDEINALRKAIKRGNGYLDDADKYTDESIATLRTAVRDGEKISDNYKEYSDGYYYGWYGDLVWYNNWSDFYAANKNKGYTYNELNRIWKDYGRSGYYYYGWYDYYDNLKWYNNRYDFVENNLGKGYSRSQLRDIWDYGWDYGWYDGWYSGTRNCANYTKSEIKAATRAINDAIDGLEKKAEEETEKKYKLTVTGDINETIDKAEYDEGVKITINPKENLKIIGPTDAPELEIKDNGASAVITMPGKDLEIAIETDTISDDSAEEDEEETEETVTVTFDSKDGTEVAAVEINKGDTVTKPTDPTREGYTFLGWFKGDSETAFDFTTPIEADLTLTAKWEKVTEDSDQGDENDVSDETTYRITVNEEGAENATVSATEAKAGDEVTITPTGDQTTETITVTVVDADNQSVNVSKEEGVYKFTMPGKDVTVTITAVDSSEGDTNGSNNSNEPVLAPASVEQVAPIETNSLGDPDVEESITVPVEEDSLEDTEPTEEEPVEELVGETVEEEPVEDEEQ